MERWSGLADVPPDCGPSVVTIGNFDGVHRGHVEVLRRVRHEAAARGARSVAVTFEPHPLHVLYPDRAPRLITPLPLRLDLLAEIGLSAALVQAFTRRLAAQTPEEYVARTFVEALGAVAVVIGADIRFGVRNSGDVDTLRRLGREHGFDVVAFDDLGSTNGSGPERRWSSTWVRELLTVGDVAGAARVLGRPHRLEGVVVHGDHRGRLLGYPTANLAAAGQQRLGTGDVGEHRIPDTTGGGDPGGGLLGFVPADGVYAGWLSDLTAPGGPRRYPAAVSVGTNPQFGGVGRRVEAYVLDRDDLELYGHRVRVELVERLRDTRRFADVDALVAQMGRDVDRCRELLAVPVGSRTGGAGG